MKDIYSQEQDSTKTYIVVAILVIAAFYLIVKFHDYQESKPNQSVEKKEIVYNSAYDGGVRQVEDYLQANLPDPKSFERIEWSKVTKTEQGNFIVRCKFRTKNNDGALQVYNKIFILGSSGIVLSVNDYGT